MTVCLSDCPVVRRGRPSLYSYSHLFLLTSHSESRGACAQQALPGRCYVLPQFLEGVDCCSSYRTALMFPLFMLASAVKNDVGGTARRASSVFFPARFCLPWVVMCNSAENVKTDEHAAPEVEQEAAKYKKNVVRGVVSNVVALALLYAVTRISPSMWLPVAVSLTLQWAVFIVHGLPNRSEKYYDLSGSLTHFAVVAVSLW